MMKGEFAEDFFTFRSESEKDFAAIIVSAGAMDETSGFEAVHQFNGTVMANLHTVRQFANARADARGHAFDGEHELILAALQAGFFNYLLAEMEKAADLIAEFGQCLVVRQSELLHAAIVSCRDAATIQYIAIRYIMRSALPTRETKGFNTGGPGEHRVKPGFS